MGGRCVNCGYSKYIEALDFHHLNPKEKDFNISKVRSYNFENIKSELAKCVLLCANCHREVHADIFLGNEREWLLAHKQPTDDTPLESYQKPIKKTKIDWPSDDKLKELVWEYPRSHLSKVLKISDVSIAKRLRLRGIDQPPRGYWSKLNTRK